MNRSRLARFRESVDSGATSVEYGLMVSLITVVIAGSVFTFGQAVMSLFGALAPTL
jgi:Flp pilus assembly pilin Flp